MRPLTDRGKLDAISDALSSYDITASRAWNDLDSLSSHTSVDEIEIVPEGVFQTENGFAAAVTIYVELNYGNKRDAVTGSDSFPGQVEGHFETTEQGTKALIDLLTVDTSSF